MWLQQATLVPASQSPSGAAGRESQPHLYCKTGSEPWALGRGLQHLVSFNFEITGSPLGPQDCLPEAELKLAPRGPTPQAAFSTIHP